MKTLIIIPTLNESKNIEKLVYKIFKNSKLKILVIDDNSKDGTINILNQLKKNFLNGLMLHQNSQDLFILISQMKIIFIIIFVRVIIKKSGIKL